MKLKGWIYQAATQVNVLSPVTKLVAEVDTVHDDGRQHMHNRKGEGVQLCRGLRQWHDIRWKMCELGRSIGLLDRYTKTSCEKQELVDGPVEVGLTGSTRRTGKPATRGSGQRKCDGASITADTQKSGRHHG